MLENFNIDKNMVIIFSIIFLSLIVILGFILLIVFVNKKKHKIVHYKEDINYKKEFLNDKTTISFDHKTQKELNAYKNERIKQINEEVNQYKNKIIEKILIDSFEGITVDLVNSSTTERIKLSDESQKAYIIGKKGNNKKIFEQLTGAEIIVEKDKEVIISCFNPIKKQIAINAINRLKEKIIDPVRIEKVVADEKRKVEENIIKIGKDVTENTMNITDLNPELYELIGKLNYRHSFSQNVLKHSCEVGLICERLAKTFKLDPLIAKKCGFLHDIGKVTDFDNQSNHIKEGLKIAKKYNLEKEVQESIASHHEVDTLPNVYAWFVKIADTISASRMGARHMTKNNLHNRVREIENICKQNKDIQEAHVYRGGKTLHVYVKPNYHSKQYLNNLAFDLKKKIQQNTECAHLNVEISVFEINRVNL